MEKVIKERAKAFTKGNSVVFVTLDWLDDDRRVTNCEAQARGYAVGPGGRVGASCHYTLDEGEYALRFFNARCHDLLDRGYEVRNCVRILSGGFLSWNVPQD